MGKKIDLNKKLIVKLPSIREIAVILSIGVVLGYLGPLGSYESPLLIRLLYWVIAVAVGYVVYNSVYRFCYFYAKKKNVPYLLTFIIGACLSAFFLTFILAAYTSYFWDVPYGYWDRYLFHYPQVFIIGIVIGSIDVFVRRYIGKQLSAKNDGNVAGDSFLKRLPTEIGKELICFVMEDHYLRVYTSEGEHLLLHRMKDALEELKDYNGTQVHRSWWIAIDKVKKVKKETRKAKITMINGVEVPVSQKYLPQIKEVGLI